MPRPSMFPTARRKIINVILRAEKEKGYMHVAAALRAALALLPAEQIPPHPAPSEIREAVAGEIEGRGIPAQPENASDPPWRSSPSRRHVGGLGGVGEYSARQDH